jgi:hypothetical protein
VVAFILAVLLHAGAVVWVEMRQETPPSEVSASILIPSMDEVIFERDSGTGGADGAGGRTAVD